MEAIAVAEERCTGIMGAVEDLNIGDLIAAVDEKVTMAAVAVRIIAITH
ncbi:hypothetical protein [Oceanobacillus piezotolerans]|nr:hypothetical protein [Oceanobacillus piezotolerans]